ncbi:MAG: aminoacetone oxidase family FAD-binding enzyme [Candidatus Methylomirabilia bacterium]
MGARGEVIVIGGGAAGLVAAIAAARHGAAVTVLERLPRVGKKLLATGNGRCNFANAHLAPHRFHGADPGFAGAALAAFGLEATLSFFRDLGIEPRREEAGKIFPRSGQASSVLDVLRHELARLGVGTRCEAEVTRLAPHRAGWEVALRDEHLGCGAAVLASGGRASPQLGSNGSGYELVRPLGHRLIQPFPALTRIRVASPYLKHLKGVKIEGVATLVPQRRGSQRGLDALDESESAAAGEILFTETGLSGPPILDLSRRAGELAQRGEGALVQLDLCPEIAANDLEALLRERFGRRADTSVELALVGFLNKRLIGPALKVAGIADPTRPAAALGEPDILALAGVCKRWPFEVTGTDSWRDAQVTAGGVDVADVCPETLESRLAPGLFFAGEILDIDGDCGGFNLQWAWSSGHLAGTEAARRAGSTLSP